MPNDRTEEWSRVNASLTLKPGFPADATERVAIVIRFGVGYLTAGQT